MLRPSLRTAARVIVMSTRAVAISAIALGSTAPANAGTNEFTLVGPEGGSILQVQFHPGNPSIVHAVTTAGYYRSIDSGLNWSLVGQNLNLRFAPQDLAVDPSNPNRILVGVPGEAPLVSTDGGATLAFAANFPFTPADVQHIEFSADGTVVYGASGVRIVRSTDSGRTWSLRTSVTTNPGNVIQFLRIDPLNPQSVYVVVLGVGGFRSMDGGDSWQPVPALPANTFDMAITTTTPQRIWAASLETGLHVSTDGGATFPVRFPAGPDPAAVMTIALDPQNHSVVYVSLANHGVFRTADGNGWANVTGNARIGLVTAIAVNPLDSTRLMLGGQAGIVSGSPKTDGSVGGTWERRDRGVLATNAGDMSFASGSRRIYIGTTFSGVHFLADGSAAAAPANNQALFELQPFPTQATAFGLLAQSRGSDRLFLGMGNGYARSDDGGGTWQLGSTGGDKTVLHFADSPGNPDLILASTQPGIHRSTDGGDTWVPVTTGLPALAEATALVFSPAAPNTVFAGIQVFPGWNGVYKSTDGGASWSPANAGFETSEIRDLAVHPTNAQVAYAAANVSGLLKTTDGGATWSRLDWLNGPGNTLAVAIDPDRPHIVYAAGFNTFARSVDAGATWHEVRSRTARPEWQVNKLLVDPRRSSTLLAATFSHGVAEMTIAPNLVLETGGSFVNPVVPGAQESYRYRLRNAGPFDATGARAVVTLPADASGISATTTNGACVVQGVTVTCSTAMLAAMTAADIEVKATHPAVGTIEVLASVSGDQPDPAAADNQVRYTVTVVQPVPAPPAPPAPPAQPSGGGGGGGGGGSNSFLWILVLAVSSLVRSYARPRRFSTSGVGPSNVVIATLPTYFRSRTPTGVV
jgi:photosystem II stability/assembly factor-like uncharacterized protein